MKIGLCIQARSKSTRFPNKVFEMLGDKQVLRHLVDTCKSVSLFPKQLKIETKILIPDGDFKNFSGYDEAFAVIGADENDLLTRYACAITENDYDAIVRLTSDCPLLPKNLIEETIKGLLSYDYVSNTIKRTFPDGFDIQAMHTKAFEWYRERVKSEEHLFQTLDCNLLFQEEFQEAGFTIHQIVEGTQQILNPYHPGNKLSIDDPSDLERCKKVWEAQKK